MRKDRIEIGRKIAKMSKKEQMRLMAKWLQKPANVDRLLKELRLWN